MSEEAKRLKAEFIIKFKDDPVLFDEVLKQVSMIQYIMTELEVDEQRAEEIFDGLLEK